MAAKPDNEKTPKKAAPKAGVDAKKTGTKSRKQYEEDNDLGVDDDEKPTKGKKVATSKGVSDDDDLDEIEEEESIKPEEDEDWDPDFDEFDLPKSTAKKTGTLKKTPKDDDDDFKIDDEFKDLFGGGKKSSKYDDDDDDY